MKYDLIPKIKKELKQHQHDWVLKKQHIASIISRHTGIPEEKILKKSQSLILELEKNIAKRVFGQDQAIHEICETLKTSYAGLTSNNKPLGSFLLLGPTGVGKTETARAIAENLFETEDNMFRIDMSEYSGKHEISKLIGAPPGYVGYEQGGTLTQAVKRRPYSVILFDEIEKAHIDFSDILLQILEEGRLTDGQGKEVSF